MHKLQPVEIISCVLTWFVSTLLGPEYEHIPVQQRLFEKLKQSDCCYIPCTVLHVPVSKFTDCWIAVVKYGSLHLTSRHQ